MIRRHPFLAFILSISVAVFLVIQFIQSKRFAGFISKVISVYLPEDAGVQFSFNSVAVQFFPPAIGVSDFSLKFINKKGRILPGSSVRAKEVSFVFLPFQILRGDIRVNELGVRGAELEILVLDTASKTKRKAGELTLRWDELLQIRAESIVLSDSKARVSLYSDSAGTRKTPTVDKNSPSASPIFTFSTVARSFQVSQWMGKGGLGYAVEFWLQDLHLNSRQKLPLDRNLVQALGIGDSKEGVSWQIPEVRTKGKVNAVQTEFDRIQARLPLLEVDAKASLAGNILVPEQSSLTASVQASMDWRVLSEHLGGTLLSSVPKSVLPKQGRSGLTLDLTLNASNPLSSLKAKFAISSTDLSAPQLAVDRVSISGELQGTGNGGPLGANSSGSFNEQLGKVELDLRSATIESAPLERQSLLRFGGGGRLEVVPFKSLLKNIGLSPIELQLKDAHIHWLAAPGARTIFPLSFRTTGKVELRRLPDSEDVRFELKIPNLFVDRLVLDNQKFETNKPRTRILDVPRIRLQLEAELDSDGFDGIQATLKLDRSRVRVTGSIDFTEGLDLSAEGNFDLADIGILAESPIKGAGFIAAKVHGPFSGVVLDFDPVLEGAKYLNINLDRVRGRVSYDDRASIVYLRKITSQIKSSKFLIDGLIDLKGDTHQAIGIQVQSADVHDLLYAFKDIAAPLWWYPETLRGSVGGEAKISGPVDYAQMSISGLLYGNHWDYFGEKFDVLRAQGGYDRGKYYISNFRATKKGGKLGGRVSYVNQGNEAGTLDWDVKTDQLTLSDLDLLSNLDVPMRGKLSARSRGQGKLGGVESTTQVDLTDLVVRGIPMEESWLEVKAAQGDIYWRGRGLGNHAQTEGVYSSGGKKVSNLKLLLEDCDFSPVVLLLNPKLISDLDLEARVAGELKIQFDADAIELGTGEMTFDKFYLKKRGAIIELAESQRVPIRKGSFLIEQLILKSKGLEATLDLEGQEGQLKGSVAGEVDASVSEFLTPVVHEAQGPIQLGINIGGTLRQPLVEGSVRVTGGYARVQGLDSPIEAIQAEAKLNQGVVKIESGAAELAGGKVKGHGQIEIFPDRYPEVDLQAAITGSRVKVYPFQYIKVTGMLGVKGKRLPYLIDGDLRSDSGLIIEKFSGSSSVGSVKAARFYPLRSEDEDSTQSKFKLNIRATSNHGILIQNDLFDAEGRGDVRIVNTLNAPRIIGNAEIIQGKLMFRDRDFVIQSGAAIFDNPTTFNPKFNLTANTELGTTKVQLYVSGNLENMKIDLSSNPAMTQSEIFSLLLQGGTNLEGRKFTGSERSTFEAGDIASIVLHQWDVARDIKAKTGFEFDIDESVNSKLGNSVLRGGAGAYQGPKLSVRRRIGKKLQLSGRTSVGSGAQEQTFQADLQVTPNFSVIGVMDNLGGVSQSVNPFSFGFDLKLQRKFK